MNAELIQTIVVPVGIGLLLLASLLVYLAMQTREQDQGEYEELCRKCGAKLSDPMSPCPACGFDYPSAERQGGDDGDEGE